MKYVNERAYVAFVRFIIEFWYGLLTRILDISVRTQKKHWVFGADYGFTYRESSKYMIEYILNNHREIHCCFITNSKSVKKELDAKGIPCCLNNSIKGIVEISKAEACFFTQYFTDIRYAFKKKNRSYYYFTHGQPYKKCLCALPKREEPHKSILLKSKLFLSQLFSVDYGMADVSFVPSTSDFLTPYMEKIIGHGVKARVLGMPRNDRLFNKDEMAKEKWLNNLEGKFVVTYMPTHRNYGKGELTPVPFESNKAIQDWMRENNVVLLMKQHPNMMPKLTNPINTDVIKDITKDALDPQVVLYHTDILITDYSSVFIDYLLLSRPIIFYIYDNYADDEGYLYDIREDFPDTFCYNEENLFAIIQDCVEKKCNHVPGQKVVQKYNKYIDGKSCERYYNEIIKDLKY